MRTLAKMPAVSWLAYATAVATGYILGSIPTGFLVARARGIDIRQAGSGNIGATNAFRVLGRNAGIAVLLIDAGKGWLACSLALHGWYGLGGAVAAVDAYHTNGILAGMSAVLGHIYSPWLRFKGGKGVATTAGVMLALVPKGLLLAVAVWLVVFFASRFVSLASIAAGVALPFVTWLTGYPWPSIGLMAAIAGLAIYQHRANIERLRAGTENRFDFRRKPRSDTQ